MPDLYEEYCGYYRARARKFEGRPLYGRSLKAEQELCTAFVSAGSAEAFRDRPDHMQLILNCGIAQVLDKEEARLKHFTETEETVRRKAPEDILSWAESVKDVLELLRRSSETEARVSIETAVDLFTDYFFSDFTALENIEVWKTADIPATWKQEMEENIRESTEEARKHWREIVTFRAGEWKPGWRFNPALVHETRHRRKIPVPDEVVEQRLKEFIHYRGTDHAG